MTKRKLYNFLLVYKNLSSWKCSSASGTARTKASSRLKSVINRINDNTQRYTSYYEYDNYGRISKYSETFTQGVSDAKKLADTTYTYDDFGQLKTSSNASTGKDRIYEYSSAGNLSSVKENGAVIKSFTYDSENKDLLTKYNNKNITWHNGLLLNTYNGSIYTWKYDQRLAQISMPSKTISFGYNDEGIRTKKTVGGKTTEYVLDGSQVLFEKRSNETVRYEYDNNGLPLLMEIIPMGQTEGSKYYYVKNGKGDVVALVDKNCNVVVEYIYDDYGYITGKTGSLKDTVGTKNPYRYRSYRYDEETGLYYLNARYYNPEWGRFISADSEDLLSATMNSYNDKNLFAYCDANPINQIDDTGNLPWWGKVIVGAVVIATCAAVTVATGGAGAGVAGFIAAGALKGAVVGAATGAVTSAGIGAVSHRISTGSWEGAGKAALEAGADGMMTGTITGAVTGGLSRGIKAIRNTSTNSSSLPKTSKRNSSMTRYNKKGVKAQTRFYNRKGKAFYDLDYLLGPQKGHSMIHGHKVNFANLFEPRSGPINNLWKSRW